MFKDRIEAGYALAEKLKRYKGVDGIVLAMLKGSVPTGYTVATELGLPLDLMFSKEIAHPRSKEHAIGAVSLSGSFVVPHNDVTPEYIENETILINRHLKELQHKFTANRPPLDVEGKTVIIVDDGTAIDNAVMTNIIILKGRKPARIVIATPVSSVSAQSLLSKQVDEVISLMTSEHFINVGAFYGRFEDVSDAQVQYYMEQSHRALAPANIEHI
jgi:putative phosphoribosyl transferase